MKAASFLAKSSFMLLAILQITDARDVDRVVFEAAGSMTTGITHIYYDKALNKDWAIRGGYSAGRVSEGHTSGNNWDGIELGLSFEMSNPDNEVFHSYFYVTGIVADYYGSEKNGLLAGLGFINFSWQWDISDYDAIGFGGIPGGTFSFCYERRFE